MRAVQLVLLLAFAAILAGCGPADGEVVAGAEVAPPAVQALRIGAVQGRGERSPHEGERVELQGIVTGNFVAGMDGFFLQDATGEDDADPATSDGLWVVWPRNSIPKVRRGDRVRVAGSVAELGPDGATQTALQASDVAVLGRGAATATVLDKAPATAADWERYEGMWLRIDAPLTVSGNEALLRFGELVASFDGRLFQSTERHPPGGQAQVAQAANLRQRLVLDDNRNGEYPAKLWFLTEEQSLAPERPLRVGSVLHGVEGILQQQRGWRLQLTNEIGRIEQAPRPTMPDLPDGLRVASFNVLNYFNGNGRGGGFPTPRGAASREELVRQRDKTVAAILALQPDVAALLEVENDGYDARSSLAELVAALNAKQADADYRFVDVGKGPGSDAIRVALIYRGGRVAPQGTPAVLAGGAFGEHNREPLAQSFAAVDGGKVFTVVVNHFKSKGSCEEADAGNADHADGQGCWNAVRVAAAAELDAWMKTDPTRSGSDRALILGDLNAYGQEDPVRALRAAGWRDAFELRAAKRPYSFVFDGYAGRLDHAFASASLAPDVIAAVEWHINADESDAFDYHRSKRDPALYQPDPYRASDHDPLLLVLAP